MSAGSSLLGVPDEHGVGAERAERPGRVVVVVRPGKDEDGDLGAGVTHPAISIS